MAVVKIKAYPGEEELPDLCARCGAQATVWKDKTFYWFPGWVYILVLVNVVVFALVALLMRKTRRLRVPLCARHAGHFLNRQLVAFLGLAVVITLGILGSLAVAVLPVQQGSDMSVVVALWWVGLFFVWLVLVVVKESGGINVREITDRSITLAGVNQEFREACLDQKEWDREVVDRAARDLWKERRAPRDAEPAPDSIRPADGGESPPETIRPG